MKKSAPPKINDSLSFAKEFLQFIKESPTSAHCAKTLKNRLLQEQFSELKESESWHLQPNSKYFVCREGKTVAAFITPKKELTAAKIVASHTDSPALKVKPCPDFKVEGFSMLGLEVYGAPLYSSWLNRELIMGGEVIYRTKEKKLKCETITLEELSLIIAQLAIHIDREVNEKGLVLNPQEHLAAIVATGKESATFSLKEYLKKELQAEEIISFDLFVYPKEEGALAGLSQSLISSYRLDNLASVFTSLKALLKKSATRSTLNLAVFFDHEEFGSKSSYGAGSPFLEDILNRIHLSFNKDRDHYYIFKNKSLIISLDLAHAVHPNYLSKHEPRHLLHLNQGLVIKTNPNGKYATSPRSSLYIHEMACQLNIPLQQYVGRSDIPSGSTVGPICASQTGIATVDMGLAELSMHSARELMGREDLYLLYQFLEAIIEDEKTYYLCHVE